MGRRIKKAIIRFKPFSTKQKKILTWWLPESPAADKDGVIADGAIRSGKTVSMSLSFGLWAMTNFNGQNFIMAGKTVGSFRRNVLRLWAAMMKARGYAVKDKRSENLVVVSRGSVENYFYVFGGKDEASQDLVQGITAAGAFFDEVALMPESFVNQATARCSVDGSKFWFNCNPASPQHWFKVGWIDKCKEKNLVYLHFTMDDNLSLSERIKERYRGQYSGVFYQRFILGLWVIAEGIIYPMFGKDSTVPTVERKYTSYVISMDYGIQNPTAMLLWGFCDGVWYQVDEYYHSGRETSQQKTDQDYYDDLEQLAGDRYIDCLIIDPSATSFIALVKQKRRFKVRSASNDVIEGIQKTASAIQQGKIKVNDCCKRTIKEYGLYSWDQKADCDRPIKDNDHAMDATRYFVNTMQIMKPKSEYRSLLN